MEDLWEICDAENDEFFSSDQWLRLANSFQSVHIFFSENDYYPIMVSEFKKDLTKQYKEAIILIKNNVDYLFKLANECDFLGISEEFCLTDDDLYLKIVPMLNGVKEKALISGNTDEYFNAHNLSTALDLIFYMSHISVNHLERKYLYELINAFELGKIFSVLNNLIIDHQIFKREYKFEGNKLAAALINQFHKIKSREYIKEVRWEKFQEDRQKVLDEARMIAEDHYKEGKLTPHNTLVKWLKEHKNKYGDRFIGIPNKILRKTVGAVAEKYGCKAGVKKAKSREENPQ